MPVRRTSGRSDKRNTYLVKCFLGLLRRNDVRVPGATISTPENMGSRWFQRSLCVTAALLWLQVNEVTVEQLVQQYPHITFSTVLQDCKRTLERAYQMGWTPNMSAASS